jgi:hypothetical protein
VTDWALSPLRRFRFRSRASLQKRKIKTEDCQVMIFYSYRRSERKSRLMKRNVPILSIGSKICLAVVEHPDFTREVNCCRSSVAGDEKVLIRFDGIS